MTYLRRELVCERLRLSRSASYRMIGSTRLSLISSDEVLELLNRSRRGTQNVISEIPSDIVTAEELVAGDPDLSASGITPAKVLAWAKRRTKNIPPHYRINSQTRRFRRSAFKEWMDAGVQRRG